VFYGCFRWEIFYQGGGFLVGLCKGLSLLNSGELGVTITIEDPVEYLHHKDTIFQREVGTKVKDLSMISFCFFSTSVMRFFCLKSQAFKVSCEL
jgi:hypothetical protein